MFTRPFLIRLAALTAISLLPIPIMATTVPEDAHLDFTVRKDGDVIGHHRIDLSRNGDIETIAIQTNILVTLAYVPVYRFEHTGRETWRDGHLLSLQSHTNDDGDKHVVSVSAENDHIAVTGDGVASQASADIIPASLWNHDLVTQKLLLNTLTGKQMTVSVADLGDDTIRSHGASTKAHHYKVTGDLERELWYVPAGTLAQVKFKAKDNSEILYVLE